jgi:hypothetical protein
MAAIAVTSANTNTQAQGTRVCVRNSSGTPYIVLEDTTDGGIEVWKGAVAGSTYYFDGSDVAAADPDTVWTDETNSDDGATGTKATTTSDSSDPAIDEIYIEGTNAPASGNEIAGVKARIHGGTAASQAWGLWFPLDTPSGGWTWAKLQSLEVAIYGEGPDVDAVIYLNGRVNQVIIDHEMEVAAALNDYAVTRVEIQVFESSATPTSFIEQDLSNNPQTAGYGSCSAAIDSTDIIHIAYMYYNGKTSELRYVTFDADGTTDTFSGDAQIIADIGDDPTAITALSTAITVDSSDIPHVAYTEWNTDMGSSWSTIKYNNRVGGAWNASGTEIEGVTANKACVSPDISIDSNNVPCISYANVSDEDLGSAIETANDSLTFTLHDISTDLAGDSLTSIAVDSAGDQWVGWTTAGTANQQSVVKHTKASAWTTGWSAEFDVTELGNNTSITIDGTDVYVFYQDTEADQRIAYDKYTGSWAGETILETPPAAEDFVEAKAKWSYLNNYDSTGVHNNNAELDYTFRNSTDNDIYWNTLTLAAPALFKAKTIWWQ